MDQWIRVALTSKNSWEPHDVKLSQVEARTQTCIPWKQEIQSTYTMHREYLDPRSDDVILDLIDPLLVRLSDGRLILETISYYPETEHIPTRRSFVSLERHAKITA